MAACLIGPAVLALAHPADTNDDNRLELTELTAYVSAWEQDLDWQGSPIEDDFAWQAIRLWRQGERYRLEPGPPEPFAWVPDPSDTDFVALENLRPQPLDRVPVYGLPADGEPVEASFTVAGYAGDYIARVVYDSDGAPALIVPINPFEINGGGELLFTFSRGGQQWRAGPVELEPLDPAPQAFHMLRDSVRTWLVDYGNRLDRDLPALLSLPIDEVPEGLLPPLALLHEIEGPLVDNNLNALLDGSAPVLEGEALDLDLFERIVAKLELAERLPDIPEPENEVLQSMSSLAASSLQTQDADGHPDQITIEDGLDLAEAMQQQKTAEEILGGLETIENFVEDRESNLEEANEVLDALKSLPGADLEKIENQQRRIKSVNLSSGYVEWFMRAVEFINHYNAGILPKGFDAMAVSVRRAGGYDWIYEDDCSPATVSALATASSSSVRYGAEKSFVPEGLQQTVLPDILPSWDLDIPTGTVTFGPGGVSVDGEWVPSFTWPDIEVAIGNIDNSDSMVDVTVLEPDLPFEGRPRSAQGGSQIIGSEVVPDVDAYVGVTGTATIQVTAKAQYFGGQSIQRTAPYQLRALDPLIFDYPQFITPGDPLLIRASLAAEQQGLEEIEWEVTDANGIVINSYVESMQGDDIYLLDLAETPEDSAAYPLDVVFRSVTEDCLRASDQAPPRESQVRIESAGFEIDPVPHCLAEEDEWIFFAKWPDGEPPENVTSVDWMIESGGGSLSVEGPFSVRYTAPGSSGQVTLRAENADDPDEFATATFRVGCGLGAELWFDAEADFPPVEGTTATKAIRLVYWTPELTLGETIDAAASVTIDSVETVDGHPGFSVAEGTFNAWGLALEANGLLYDFESYDRVVNDSGNNLEYATPGPGDDTYTVSVTIGYDGFVPGDKMRLNAAGTQIEIDFTASGSISGLSGGEVDSYTWNTSSGDNGTGPGVTLQFPADPGPAWVEVIATDNLGNTARQLVRLNIVYVAASFAFDFRDDGGFHTSFPFGNPMMPGPTGSSFLAIDVVGNPLSGSATTGGSATSSQLIEIEQDDDDPISIFRIEYQPEL